MRTRWVTVRCNPRIQADEKIDGALPRGLQCGDGGLEQRPAVVDMHIGRQVAAQILGDS